MVSKGREGDRNRGEGKLKSEQNTEVRGSLHPTHVREKFSGKMGRGLHIFKICF